MSQNHLAPEILSALADGELSTEQLATAQQHLVDCSECTSDALAQTLLKAATARAGHRCAPSAQFLAKLAQQSKAIPATAGLRIERKAFSTTPQLAMRMAVAGWAAAAVLLLASGTVFVLQHHTTEVTEQASLNSSLATEIADQHIATLATTQPPQVISSDRHTVKPWFQGRIPFAFNLPENLPSNITLDGANLAYLHNHPAAQLLYSIGKHHVSIFVQEKSESSLPGPSLEHSGFHVLSASTGDLNLIAISDADPAKVTELLNLLQQSQAKSSPGHI